MTTEVLSEEVAVDNLLDMSDEEFMKLSGPPEVSAPAEKTETEEKPAEGSEATGSGEGDEKKNEEGEEAEAAADGVKAPAEAPAKPAEAEKPEGTKEEVKAEKAIDYEAEYKRLLAPFKANGKEIKVESIDDALSLMQMGANYNKKMAALKPNLKIMKMLENNGLMSEEKIGFLIDLDKKNPGAINKLVKESGIDPMELDAEKASAYKQTPYAVDDREIDLDTVLDELQGTETYTRTLDVVSNKWDVASKQAIAQAPQLLKVINDHMASGIYDLISTEIERERVFGRLKGVSDIEAYRQVGDAIQAKGGFDHLFQKKPEQRQSETKPVVVQPKPKVDQAALNDKRRAASGTKLAAPSTAPKEFNPLAMPDDEFEKMATPAFR